MRVADWIGSGPGRLARARLLAALPHDAELSECDVRRLDALRVRELLRDHPEAPQPDRRVDWRVGENHD